MKYLIMCAIYFIVACCNNTTEPAGKVPVLEGGYCKSQLGPILRFDSTEFELLFLGDPLPYGGYDTIPSDGGDWFYDEDSLCLDGNGRFCNKFIWVNDTVFSFNLFYASEDLLDQYWVKCE